MNIYKYEIPIYHGDDMFMQPLYVESHKCPTKDQLLVAIGICHDVDSKFAEYTGQWKNAYDTVKNCKDFPILTGRMAQSSRLVKVKGYFRMFSLIVRVVNSIRIKG